MNNLSFRGLHADVKRELHDLQRVVDECQEVLKHEEWPDLAFNRTLGSLLHDFYTGVEKIFQRIVLRLDGDLPAGPSWHVQLLRRVATPVEHVRPAVLDEATAQALGEYLRFRHVFRAVYGFELRRSRLRELTTDLPDVFAALQAQLTQFLEFLQALDASMPPSP
jgi:hypothetical protein